MLIREMALFSFKIGNVDPRDRHEPALMAGGLNPFALKPVRAGARNRLVTIPMQLVGRGDLHFTSNFRFTSNFFQISQKAILNVF